MNGVALQNHTTVQQMADQVAAAKVLQENEKQEVSLHGNKAEEYAKKGWYREAIKEYTKLLFLLGDWGVPSAGTSLALGKRCSYLESTHALKKALKDARQLAELDPLIYENDFRLGVIHSKLANSPEAIKFFEKFIGESNHKKSIACVLLAFEKGERETVLGESSRILQELTALKLKEGEEALGKHAHEEIVLYTKRGLVFAAKEMDLEALKAFEMAISLIEEHESDDEQPLMELHIFCGLASLKLQHQGKQRPIPLSSLVLVTKSNDVFYRRCPTEGGGASGLHALLGTRKNDLYICPQVRSVFTNKLREHFANNVQDIEQDEVRSLFSKHILSLWQDLATTRPLQPQAKLVFVGIYTKIINELDQLKEKELVLQDKLSELLNQIVSVAEGEDLTEMARFCNFEGSDQEFIELDIRERQRLFSSHTKYISTLFSLKNKSKGDFIYKELWETIMKRFCEEKRPILAKLQKLNEEKLHFFAFKPEILEAYYAACESEEYRFSDVELQIGAHLFNKNMQLVTNEETVSSPGEGPLVMINRMEEDYERYDDSRNHTYEQLALEHFDRLKELDKNKEIFSATFFSPENEAQARVYYEAIQMLRLPVPPNDFEKRWRAMITLAERSQKGKHGLSRNPKQAKLLYFMASQLIFSTHPTERAALAFYENIIRADFQSAIAHYEMAQIHRKAGNLPAAKSDYQLALLSEHSQALYQLGRLYQSGQIHVVEDYAGIPTRVDRELAINYLEMANHENRFPLSGAASHVLGLMYYKGRPRKIANEQGYVPVHEKAYLCFQSALAAGYDKSHLPLAWMNMHGQGISSPNLKEAQEHAKLATYVSSTRKAALFCLNVIQSLVDKDKMNALTVTDKASNWILLPHVAANAQGHVVVTFGDIINNANYLRGGIVNAAGRLKWIGERIRWSATTWGMPIAINDQDSVVTAFEGGDHECYNSMCNFNETFAVGQEPGKPHNQLMKGLDYENHVVNNRGSNPSVAMWGTRVVSIYTPEIHASLLQSNCLVGDVKDANPQEKEILWRTNWLFDSPFNYYTDASRPRRAIAVKQEPDQKAKILLAFVVKDEMSFYFGVDREGNGGGKIGWASKEPSVVKKGVTLTNPSMTFIGGNRLLIVAQGNADYKLYCCAVSVDWVGNRIIEENLKWQCYGIGKHPSVAFSKGHILEFHENSLFEGAQLVRADTTHFPR